MARARSDEKSPTSSATTWIARGLLLLWVGFWLWFNLASGISEVSELGWGALAAHMTTALVMGGVGIAAWLWPRIGGLALIALAAVMAWFFHPTLGVAAILVLPPALIGTLLLLAPRRPGAPPATESAA